MINWNRKYIEETYPEIYGLDKYGLCVGDGWIPMINRLTDQLVSIIKLHNEETDDECVIELVQIKEKFGGLRYYYSIDSEDTAFKSQIRDIVSVYEHASYFICEVCGAYGERSRCRGWYKTVCDEHRKVDEDGEE